jgi:indolepyruvate decarboxylase
MPNLARTLLQAVRAHGAREIFGIPGDFALPFCREIEDSAILPLYTHEPAIGFAADAASRFRASISVAAVTWGAGALNLVNATAGAYAERVPVVVVSGAPGTGERSSGWKLHHMARALDTQTAHFSRDHLRPGGAGRSGVRPRRNRPRAARSHRLLATGLHRSAA